MEDRTLKPAMLRADEAAKLQQLESELGDDVIVIAYAKPEEPAELDPDKVEKLKAIEKELGNVYLVALEESPLERLRNSRLQKAKLLELST